jgi:hypothetical protein
MRRKGWQGNSASTDLYFFAWRLLSTRAVTKPTTRTLPTISGAAPMPNAKAVATTTTNKMPDRKTILDDPMNSATKKGHGHFHGIALTFIR